MCYDDEVWCLIMMIIIFNPSSYCGTVYGKDNISPSSHDEQSNLLLQPAIVSI